MRYRMMVVQSNIEECRCSTRKLRSWIPRNNGLFIDNSWAHGLDSQFTIATEAAGHSKCLSKCRILEHIPASATVKELILDILCSNFLPKNWAAAVKVILSRGEEEPLEDDCRENFQWNWQIWWMCNDYRAHVWILSLTATTNHYHPPTVTLYEGT